MNSKLIVGITILTAAISGCSSKSNSSKLASLSASTSNLSTSSSGTGGGTGGSGTSTSSSSSSSSISQTAPADLEVNGTLPATWNFPSYGSSATTQYIPIKNVGGTSISLQTSIAVSIQSQTSNTGSNMFSAGPLNGYCNTPISPNSTSCTIPVVIAPDTSASGCRTASASVTVIYTDANYNSNTLSIPVSAKSAICGTPGKLQATAVPDSSFTFPSSAATWTFTTGDNIDGSGKILDVGNSNPSAYKSFLIKLKNVGGFDVTLSSPVAAFANSNPKAIGWRNMTVGAYYNRENGTYPGGVPANTTYAVSPYLPLCGSSLAAGASCYMAMSFYPFASASDYLSQISITATDANAVTSTLSFKVKGHGN